MYANPHNLQLSRPEAIESASSKQSSTALCPHWNNFASRSSLPDLTTRFKTVLFQRALQQRTIECLGCLAVVELGELWACLYCTDPAAIRCSANLKRHAVTHFEKTQHALAINLGTRMIWCYACDREIPDVDTSSTESATPFAPQDIRILLLSDSSDQETQPHATSMGVEREEHRVLTFAEYFQNGKGGTVGLANLGNTCFFNSGLQALLHTPALIGLFVDMIPRLHGHNKCIDSEDGLTKDLSRVENGQIRLAEDFVTLMQKVWSGEYRSCNPRDLLRDTIRLHPYFDGYGQHDSQEFLRHFLDFLHEGLRFKCGFSVEAVDSKPAVAESERKEPKNLKRKRPYSNSIIADIFQGWLRSEVMCGNCGNVSVTEDMFYDISMEIPREQQLKRVEVERGESALTPQPPKTWLGTFWSAIGLGSKEINLETCLHSFCTSDQLIKKDQYKCDKCQQKVDATKVLSICQLPEVLMLHIKRFTHSGNSYINFGGKLSQHVSFPARDLDMAPFLSKPRADDPDDLTGCSPSDSKYDLYAMVKHMGSVSGGHYIAYAQSHITGQWYEFDDRQVTPVSEADVVKEQAYVLFYRRKSQSERRGVLTRSIQSILTAAPPPSDERRYISNLWLRKAEVMVGPGLIDNRDLCCEHGIPYPQERVLPDYARICYDERLSARTTRRSSKGRSRSNRAESDESLITAEERQSVLEGKTITVGNTLGSFSKPVSVSDWNTLYDMCKGGPEVTGKTHRCPQCDLPLVRMYEKEHLFGLNNVASAAATKNGQLPLNDPPEGWFIIEASWLLAWRKFIAGGPRPGPVTNHLLFEEDNESSTNSNSNPSARLKPGLKIVTHYRGLYQSVWNALVFLYGGGPVIRRSSLDIYAIESSEPSANDMDQRASTREHNMLSENDSVASMDTA